MVKRKKQVLRSVLKIIETGYRLPDQVEDRLGRYDEHPPSVPPLKGGKIIWMPAYETVS